MKPPAAADRRCLKSFVGCRLDGTPFVEKRNDIFGFEASLPCRRVLRYRVRAREPLIT